MASRRGKRQIVCTIDDKKATRVQIVNVPVVRHKPEAPLIDGLKERKESKCSKDTEGARACDKPARPSLLSETHSEEVVHETPSLRSELDQIHHHLQCLTGQMNYWRARTFQLEQEMSYLRYVQFFQPPWCGPTPCHPGPVCQEFCQQEPCRRESVSQKPCHLLDDEAPPPLILDRCEKLCVSDSPIIDFSDGHSSPLIILNEPQTTRERCHDPCLISLPSCPPCCPDPCPPLCPDPCPPRCPDPCPPLCPPPCSPPRSPPCPPRCPDPCPPRCPDPCSPRCPDLCPPRCPDPCPTPHPDPCPTPHPAPCPPQPCPDDSQSHHLLPIPSDPAISVEQIEISICNLSHPVRCQLVRRNSSVHIWGSVSVSGLTIDSLKGKISLTKPIDYTSLHGYVDVFNDVVSTQHHAVVVSENGALWIKFSNKPIIPIKVPMNGSLHFNLLLGF